VPDIRLERPGDPRVAEYRDVPEPELIRARGLFVAEGRLVVRRLIDERRYGVRSLLLSHAARIDLEPWLARLDPDVPVYICGRSFPRHDRARYPSRLPGARATAASLAAR